MVLFAPKPMLQVIATLGEWPQRMELAKTIHGLRAEIPALKAEQRRLMGEVAELESQKKELLETLIRVRILTADGRYLIRAQIYYPDGPDGPAKQTPLGCAEITSKPSRKD